MDNDAELERKAVEEILNEAKRGRIRAETMGPSGWMKSPVCSTNKRFLVNTIRSTLPPQRQPSSKHKERDPKADMSLRKSRKEDNSKNHHFHPYKRNQQSRKKSISPTRSRKSNGKGDKKRK
ncbi:protein POLR1D [Protopterus annectens]|uniref:protein POLR1D n=1 Tax=Protopterus annectens TaxID=7888 RepID=UPI001CF9D2CB|nr:protein POLR1D [Protopterus annectens]